MSDMLGHTTPPIFSVYDKSTPNRSEMRVHQVLNSKLKNHITMKKPLMFACYFSPIYLLTGHKQQVQNTTRKVL